MLCYSRTKLNILNCDIILPPLGYLQRTQDPHRISNYLNAPNKHKSTEVKLLNWTELEPETMLPKQAPRSNTLIQNKFDFLQEQFALLMTRYEAPQLEIDELYWTQSRLSSLSPMSPGPEPSLQNKKPSLSKPEPFSGTEDLPLFPQQCELFFELQPTQFSNDFFKVGFILNHLQGFTLKRVCPYLLNCQHELWSSLELFTAAMEEAFGDPTLEFRCTEKLHALKPVMSTGRVGSGFAIGSDLTFVTFNLTFETYKRYKSWLNWWFVHYEM